MLMATASHNRQCTNDRQNISALVNEEKEMIKWRIHTENIQVEYYIVKQTAYLKTWKEIPDGLIYPNLSNNKKVIKWIFRLFFRLFLDILKTSTGF